jgi:hypothetical protein
MKRTFSNLLKSIAITVLLTGSSQLAMAQASDNATLNVNLTEVRSIIVNPAQNAVQLDFSTAQDYQLGVRNRQVGHLIITSTAGFEIWVKCSSEYLVNGANTISVNTIWVRPLLNAGSTMPPGFYLTDTRLHGFDQRIIESSNGSANVEFDITYDADGGDEYINKLAGTYVTTLTYSILPD